MRSLVRADSDIRNPDIATWAHTSKRRNAPLVAVSTVRRFYSQKLSSEIEVFSFRHGSARIPIWATAS